MNMPKLTECSGRFVVTYFSEPLTTEALIRAILEAPTAQDMGRGGIKVIEVDGKSLVVRKYLHGGLFRALTQDRFLSGSRPLQEAEITLRLKEHGFPVADVCCAITENAGPVKRLYLVTFFEVGAVNLLDYLTRSTSRKRLRAIKTLATLFRRLEEEGIYHPDLHLNNVMIAETGELFFLDFDRAKAMELTPAHVESMLWRLARHADKMERQGRFQAKQREKVLFLRTYDHLSGRDMEKNMAAEAGKKNLFHRIGWFVESLLYRS